MASIVFSSAGSAIGGSLGGAIGSSIGNLAGSFAGKLIDQKLFSRSITNSSHGVRLKDLSVITSTYGNMIPIVFGLARVAGNIIWAQSIKETPHIRTQSMGSKGGKVSNVRTEYSYSVNLAISICEGEISDIVRVWANNRLLNLSKFNVRIYKGTETQDPDPLIQSIEGVGKTPAYRGQAYVVFEDLQLADFGNNIPNFNFEVRRKLKTEAAEDVEDLIESVVIIPGSGEYVYDTIPQKKIFGNHINGTWLQAGPAQAINQHNETEKANGVIALDQLKSTMPNIKWAAPVVTWFADDLDASICKILPGVEFKGNIRILPDEWSVAGFKRDDAKLVTQVDGKPVYGGTINDASIIRWIEELKSREYNVMFYPMFFMDMIGKPWRGRLTGDASIIENFFNKSDGYNNFILHYAKLMKGKIDAFVIGSELIGLTSVKDENNNFPAVRELAKLAGEVKAILGSEVKVIYAADWSEYHHTKGGWYNMDELWACESIDVIGIDAYFPLTNSPNSTYETQDIFDGWKSGEGYNFCYEDRAGDIKKEIGKEYAWKNIEWFWSNEHYNPNGKKTKWVPKSKKIWFTEYGFPSVDCCTNQPNVFYDPVGNESVFPFHSKGKVDNKAQGTAIYATEKFWQNSEMVERKFLWTWDARPYPYWPDLMSVWCDGEAWAYGHWVQGKLGVSSLGSVINDICKRAGFNNEDFDISKLSDTVDGFIIDQQTTLRGCVEILQDAYFFDAVENDSKIEFIPRGRKEICKIKESGLVILDKNKSSDVIAISRAQEVELPKKLDINFINIAKNFQIGNQHASRHAVQSEQKISLNLPIAMNENVAAKIAEISLYKFWMERNKYSCNLTVEYAFLSPSDLVELEFDGNSHIVRLTDIQMGKNFMLKCQGVADDPSVYHSYIGCTYTLENDVAKAISKTHIEILDLPVLPNESAFESGRILVAAAGYDENWEGCELFVSNKENEGYQNFANINQAATIGHVLGIFGEASPHLLDYGNKIIVNLIHGELHSVSDDNFNSGSNLALVGNELIYFKSAKLIAPFQYELSVFARGRQGTEIYISGHVEGDRFILINDAVQSIELPGKFAGVISYIKPVSIGDSLGNVESVAFVYKANFLKPFSVVHTVLKDGNISWIRRSRVNSFFVDNLEIPLGEYFEKYLVELFDEKGELVHSDVTGNNSYQFSTVFSDFKVTQLASNL